MVSKVHAGLDKESVDKESDLSVRPKLNKRPNNFWSPFALWWRSFHAEHGVRPNSNELRQWYDDNSRKAWPAEVMPSFKDLTKFSKGMRTLAQVKTYFREYRRTHTTTKPSRTRVQAGRRKPGASNDASEDDSEQEMEASDGYMASDCPTDNTIYSTSEPQSAAGGSTNGVGMMSLLLSKTTVSAPSSAGYPTEPFGSAALQQPDPAAHRMSKTLQLLAAAAKGAALLAHRSHALLPAQGTARSSDKAQQTAETPPCIPPGVPQRHPVLRPPVETCMNEAPPSSSSQGHMPAGMTKGNADQRCMTATYVPPLAASRYTSTGTSDRVLDWLAGSWCPPPGDPMAESFFVSDPKTNSSNDAADAPMPDAAPNPLLQRPIQNSGSRLASSRTDNGPPGEDCPAAAQAAGSSGAQSNKDDMHARFERVASLRQQRGSLTTKSQLGGQPILAYHVISGLANGEPPLPPARIPQPSPPLLVPVPCDAPSLSWCGVPKDGRCPEAHMQSSSACYKQESPCYEAIVWNSRYHKPQGPTGVYYSAPDENRSHPATPDAYPGICEGLDWQGYAAAPGSHGSFRRDGGRTAAIEATSAMLQTTDGQDSPRVAAPEYLEDGSSCSPDLWKSFLRLEAFGEQEPGASAEPGLDGSGALLPNFETGGSGAMPAIQRDSSTLSQGNYAVPSTAAGNSGNLQPPKPGCSATVPLAKLGSSCNVPTLEPLESSAVPSLDLGVNGAVDMDLNLYAAWAGAAVKA